MATPRSAPRSTPASNCKTGTPDRRAVPATLRAADPTFGRCDRRPLARNRASRGPAHQSNSAACSCQTPTAPSAPGTPPSQLPGPGPTTRVSLPIHGGTPSPPHSPARGLHFVCSSFCFSYPALTQTLRCLDYNSFAAAQSRRHFYLVATRRTHRDGARLGPPTAHHPHNVLPITLAHRRFRNRNVTRCFGGASSVERACLKRHLHAHLRQNA